MRKPTKVTKAKEEIHYVKNYDNHTISLLTPNTPTKNYKEKLNSHPMGILTRVKIHHS